MRYRVKLTSFKKKACYWSLIFMKFGQHIQNIYGQFFCCNGILNCRRLKHGKIEMDFPRPDLEPNISPLPI